MTSIEIRGFDPEQLEELAKTQTAIYNVEGTKLPEFVPAKVEDTIKRFKRKTFDQSRMFYAYKGDEMIGYVGLTGKDVKANSRGAGYPWLAEGADESVRDLLYDAMEKKCQDEGTQTLRVFGSPRYPKQLEFFKSKGFEIKIEYLVHQKELVHNVFEVPSGYTFRALKLEDLPILEEVSKNDPKMRTPFVASEFEQFMDSDDYDPDCIVVTEYNQKPVGYYGIYIPPDTAIEKSYFAGVAIHGDHQVIEPYLLMELENRALNKGKKIMEVTFYPDSPRLPSAKERNYIQIEHSYRLEKILK
jgi:hypothetical protein